MPTFDEDWAWQARFAAHASEIVRGYVKRCFDAILEDSSPEEDWARNTDGFIRYRMPLPNNARLSRRVRRMGYRAGYEYEQTIRLDRPSRHDAEMLKLISGYGDIELYGFGPDDERGADGPPLRYEQWFLGDLNILRTYITEGGYLGGIQRNHDHSSRFMAVDLRDLPAEYVLDSENLPTMEHGSGWLSCRNPNWTCQDPAHKAGKWTGEEAWRLCPSRDGHWKLRHGMCAGKYAVELDGRMRQCLCCGFRWRGGWESAAQRLRLERSERVLRQLYPLSDHQGDGTH